MKLIALVMTFILILVMLSSCNADAGHHRIVSENSFDDLNYVIAVTNTSIAKVRLRYCRISTGDQELPMEDYLGPGSSMRLKVKREGLKARVRLGLEEDTFSYGLEFTQEFKPYFQGLKEWTIDNGTVMSVTFNTEKITPKKAKYEYRRHHPNDFELFIPFTRMRTEGLEPSSLATLGPKPSAYANSAMSAQ